MRLIDADALIEAMKKTEAEYENAMTCPSWWSAFNVINEQPTAYDVDAVVEELEKHKTQYGKLQLAHNDANMVCVYVGKEQAIDCAIETVKAGGK